MRRPCGQLEEDDWRNEVQLPHELCQRSVRFLVLGTVFIDGNGSGDIHGVDVRVFFGGLQTFPSLLAPHEGANEIRNAVHGGCIVRQRLGNALNEQPRRNFPSARPPLLASQLRLAIHNLFVARFRDIKKRTDSNMHRTNGERRSESVTLTHDRPRHLTRDDHDSRFIGRAFGFVEEMSHVIDDDVDDEVDAARPTRRRQRGKSRCPRRHVLPKPLPSDVFIENVHQHVRMQRAQRASFVSNASQHRPHDLLKLDGKFLVRLLLRLPQHPPNAVRHLSDESSISSQTRHPIRAPAVPERRLPERFVTQMPESGIYLQHAVALGPSHDIRRIVVHQSRVSRHVTVHVHLHHLSSFQHDRFVQFQFNHHP